MDARTEKPSAASPEQIAVQINQEYSAILSEEQGGNHKLVARAIQVGAKLLHCKSIVAHGNWGPWMKAQCPALSKSTVERWMKLAENKSKIEAEIKNRNSINSTVTFLTLRQALAIANGKQRADTNDEIKASDAYDRVLACTRFG